MNAKQVFEGFVFRSAKCRRPIPFVLPLLRDRLVQLSLDRSVEALDYVEAPAVAPIAIAVRLVVAYRSEGGFVQDLGPRERKNERSMLHRLAAAQALAVDVVDPREVVAEPRLSAARAVWSTRGRRVDIGMRVALLGALAEEGPMRLDELCRLVPGPSDPITAIASLACEAALHLDLAGGFGPDTRVRA
jgi:hypothetical protein